jgi:hypothetical protein
MISPEQLANRRNAALSTRAGKASSAGYAAVSVASHRKLDRLAHRAEEKSQGNPEKIGFVSQKRINPQARDVGRKGTNSPLTRRAIMLRVPARRPLSQGEREL